MLPAARPQPKENPQVTNLRPVLEPHWLRNTYQTVSPLLVLGDFNVSPTTGMSMTRCLARAQPVQRAGTASRPRPVASAEHQSAGGCAPH